MAPSPAPEAPASAPVVPTDHTGWAPAEAPLIAATERRRNILLVTLTPLIGMLVAWTSHWPTWSRVLATAWTVLLILALVGFILSVAGPGAR